MSRLTTHGRPRLTSSLVRSGLAAVTLAAPFLADLGPWLAPALLPYAHGLSGLWLGRGLLESNSLYRQHRAWHVSPDWEMPPAAVPQGEAGLLLGKAFAWTGDHTQFLETALSVDGSLPTATGARGGHPVLHAVGQHAEQALQIPWSEMVAHTLLTGTTRSGKTRGLEVMATGVIHAPGAVVIVDPKGDTAMQARCAAEAHRAGKPFALFSPAFPQTSARFNVLDTATSPDEVCARIHALMPSAGGRTNEPFFEQFPLTLMRTIAAAQQALGQPWTLKGLHDAALIRRHQEALVEAYLLHLGCHPAPKLESVISEYEKRLPDDLTADALIDDLRKQREYFQKISSNLVPTFRGLLGPPLGPLLCAQPADLTWAQIDTHGMVVYVALTSLLLEDMANRIGRAILQDLVGYLGKRYAYHPDPAQASPLTILIDEVGDVVYPGFTNVLNKGGGANARFVLALQSFADLEAPLGRPQAQRLLDNLNTKITFRLADDRTAHDVAEGAGTCTVQLPDNGASIGYGGVGGLSGSVTRRFPQKDVPLVRPDWLKALPRGEAFVRLKGEVWKLRVPMLTPIDPHSQP